jgi:hypothetical protein
MTEQKPATLSPPVFALRVMLVVILGLLAFWIGEPGAFFVYQGF